MQLWTLKSVALLAALSFLVSCSDDGSSEPQDTPDAADASVSDMGESDLAPAQPTDDPVDEMGPFNAGFRSFTHTYERATGEQREIVINVWYPTLDTEGDEVRYLGLVRDSDSFLDAQVAESPWNDGMFPVHVYSHGSQGFGGTAAQLMRYFASHGWVSVAPDHTGNTLADNLDPRPPALRLWRSLDITETLDAVENRGDDLAAMLSTQRVFMSGHSFGGFTVWASAGASFDPTFVEQACAEPDVSCAEEDLQLFDAGVREPRVTAAATLAGNYSEDWFGATGFESVEIPIMAISGTEDPRGHAEEFNLIEGVDLTWIDVEGACHESFSLGLPCPTLDTETSLKIGNTYTLAFARHHVLGDETPEVTAILSGDTLITDAIETFSKK